MTARAKKTVKKKLGRPPKKPRKPRRKNTIPYEGLRLKSDLPPIDFPPSPEPQVPRLEKRRADRPDTPPSSESPRATAAPTAPAVELPFERPEDRIDWRNPNYTEILAARAQRWLHLKDDPQAIELLKVHYRTHLVDFVCEWGMTYNPRFSGRGSNGWMPFILTPKQREFGAWFLSRWQLQKDGLVEKSRDQGASWIAMALAISMCIFNRDMAIGVGSALEAKLDSLGDLNSIFQKGRQFIQYLPGPFRGGCDLTKDAPEKRILFPETGSQIVGEVGDKIGFGGRSSIYIVDEAALIEHPQLMHAGTSANSDCRIFISSLSLDGMQNDFAIQRHSGRFGDDGVFTLHYRDNPLMSEEYIAKKKATMDSSIWAANYEINYAGSAQGVIIEADWVSAAIDAHKKLKIEPSGVKSGSLDIADLGRDLNAFTSRHGILVTHCETWRGDVTGFAPTAERAMDYADKWALDEFCYDAEMMGAGIRTEFNRILPRRKMQGLREIHISPFRGSAAVFEPERKARGTERLNQDFFQNLKAQSWWALRWRFYETYLAVNGAKEYNPDDIISLDSSMPNLQKLCTELWQPKWKHSSSGKMMVDKTPDGMMSPNMADSVMMLFARQRRRWHISDAAIERFGGDDRRQGQHIW